MKVVRVQAYGTLCDFLPRENSEGAADERVGRASYRYDLRQLTKDAIEAVGIPHPEVELLLMNDRSAAFNAELEPDSVIEVFPHGHPKTRTTESLVRSAPLPSPRFLVDENLGKLASSLLILGFDTRFDPALDDAALATLSQREDRFLLSRDIGLLKRSIVCHGYWVRNDDPRKQISEVIRRFDLWPHVHPFTRCLDCNSPFHTIDKGKAESLVPARVLQLYQEFFMCQACQKAYWKGSHFESMSRWLDDLRREFESV